MSESNEKSEFKTTMKQLLAEESLRLLEEYREEIIRRTEKRIKDLQQDDSDKEKLS